MRINQRVYPKLEKIYKTFEGRVIPHYVSQNFFNAAAKEQDKFTEGDTVEDGLNDYHSTALHGTEFILLLNKGIIIYGKYGFYIGIDDLGRWREGVTWYIGDDGLHWIKYAKNPNVTLKTKEGEEWGAAHVVAMVKFLLVFKIWSPIEVKICPPKGKIKDDDDFNGAYKSDFPFKIGLLTANWFRQSVQGNPFPVRSHLHKYYHGPGKKEVKFNWIELYWKKGMIKGPYKEQ